MTNRLSDLISKLKLCFFLGWKPILYWLFGPKSQSFRNKSGKMQPIPDQIRYTWTCQGVTTFRELWARSVHFEINSVWDESRGARVFFCLPHDLSATSQRPIFIKFGHCPVTESGKTFSKIFTLVVIFPQNRKSVKRAPHSEQATGHVMHCRDIGPTVYSPL